MTLIADLINITDLMSPIWGLVGNFVDNIGNIFILAIVALVLVFYRKFVNIITNYIGAGVSKGAKTDED